MKLKFCEVMFRISASRSIYSIKENDRLERLNDQATEIKTYIYKAIVAIVG